MSPFPILHSQALDFAPVFLRDLSGRITHWSRRVAGLYQYDKSQALGAIAHELLRTCSSIPLRDIEEQVRASGGWRGELVDLRRDDSPVAVQSEWSLLTDEAGKPTGVLVCNAELDRTTSDRDLLASIVDGSRDAIITKNLQGLVTSWNKAAEDMFGYSADEIIGHPVTELFPEDLKAQEAIILRSILAGDRIEHYETVRLCKDGGGIEVSLTVSPVRDSAGRVVGASKIARDISEQKRLQAKLDELQRELLHISRLNDMGQLASGFAHELNQPLSALGNYLAGSRRALENGDVEAAQRGLQMASQQLERTGGVIRRLRDFLKKGEGNRRPEDLASAIEESIALALIGHREYGIRFAADIKEDASTALVDRVQLQQVFVNLFRNAAEALRDAPRREIKVGARMVNPRWLEVEVSDSGPGVPEPVLKKLFQPFNTTKTTGMGVGLSLCRTIIEAQGGQITGGNWPDGGAWFRFTLPRPESAA